MARALLFGPDDLFNPELVCSDFGHLNPTNKPGWVAGLLEYLDEHGAALPLNLLRPGATGAAQADGVAPTTAGGGGTEASLELESERLHTAFVELAHHTRAARTTAGLVNPILKQLW